LLILSQRKQVKIVLPHKLQDWRKCRDIEVKNNLVLLEQLIKLDLRKEEENQDLRKEEENQDLKREEEHQDLRREEELQDLRRDNQQQDQNKMQ
jgi:hypothetical protein